MLSLWRSESLVFQGKVKNMDDEEKNRGKIDGEKNRRFFEELLSRMTNNGRINSDFSQTYVGT